MSCSGHDKTKCLIFQLINNLKFGNKKLILFGLELNTGGNDQFLKQVMINFKLNF